jgi:cystathionine beta-lyase/cystathionine gamma-synthase
MNEYFYLKRHCTGRYDREFNPHAKKKIGAILSVAKVCLCELATESLKIRVADRVGRALALLEWLIRNQKEK